MCKKIKGKKEENENYVRPVERKKGKNREPVKYRKVLVVNIPNRDIVELTLE